MQDNESKHTNCKKQVLNQKSSGYGHLNPLENLSTDTKKAVCKKKSVTITEFWEVVELAMTSKWCA